MLRAVLPVLIACALIQSSAGCQSAPQPSEAPRPPGAPVRDATAPTLDSSALHPAPPASAPTAESARAPTSRDRDAIPGVRCSVSRLGPLSPVSEFSALDVNGDGALDVVERVAVLYAQSAGGLLISPAVARVTLPWARVARGERCIIDDPDSRAYARAQCPAMPRSLTGAGAAAVDPASLQARALTAVACARAWGATVDSIAALAARDPSVRARNPALSLEALRTFASQLNPPWTLVAASRAAR